MRRQPTSITLKPVAGKPYAACVIVFGGSRGESGACVASMDSRGVFGARRGCAELCTRRTDAVQFSCTTHWPPAAFRLPQKGLA